MPRKLPSRQELRKQAEAAEAAGLEDESPRKKKVKKKKKAAKKRATRKVKDAVLERKRLVWVIYTATLREEARFPYDQRKQAEEKLKQLLAKGKRTYFLQPVKELVSGEPAPVPVEEPEEEKAKSPADDPELNDELEDEVGGEDESED